MPSDDSRTYRCPMPGCTWRIEDDRTEKISGTLMEYLLNKEFGERHGTTFHVSEEQQHRNAVLQTTIDHLNEHPATEWAAAVVALRSPGARPDRIEGRNPWD